MSVKYITVQWNSHKQVYDLLIASAIIAYVAVFVLVSRFVWRGDHAIDPPILVIRAFGTCAIFLLHFILCIGPLARLSNRFAPLLYNRRHLGVATFLVALVHGVLVLGYYHGFGAVNPLVSLLTYDNRWSVQTGLPFQILGLGGLIILFLLASTSHDFWLKNLSPRVWKGLHMLVYLAYGLVVMHVALGALRSETNVIYPGVLLAGVALISTLHIAAGITQRRRDLLTQRSAPAEWVDVCGVDEIPESRARSVRVATEPVAVFKYGGQTADAVMRNRGDAVTLPPVVSLGVQTLRGEVIDPKCYIGAMKPGGGKTHKACAELCLAGGIPPMLAVWDGSGREVFFLLVRADGAAANAQAAPFAGEAVTVTGTIEKRDDLMVLRVAGGAFR